MKIVAGLFITLCFLISNANASPLIVRCLGSSTIWGNTVKIKIEITLPDKLDQVLTTSSLKDKNTELLQQPSPYTSVGMGTIQIIEQIGSQKSSHRHKFIVTRLPDSYNSLIGFYVTGPYVNSIRADLWKKGKPFIYFDSYNNEIIKGHCE